MAHKLGIHGASECIINDMNEYGIESLLIQNGSEDMADYHVINGAIFEEVGRKAVIGDYVVITKSDGKPIKAYGIVTGFEYEEDDFHIEHTLLVNARFSGDRVEDSYVCMEMGDEYTTLEPVGGKKELTPEFGGVEVGVSSEYQKGSLRGELNEINDAVSTLRKDLRTFAEQSTETAHELKALGKDVAKMDESIEFLDDKIAGIVEGMYADSRKDFTPAERLQYAISSGASPEEVRSFYDGFTVAIVEYSDGLDSLAPGKLAELRELVAVYREFTKPLSKGSGGE